MTTDVLTPPIIREAELALAGVFWIPERKVRVGADELAEAFVDATEWPIHRPTRGPKRYDSGKKKRHTVKNQVVRTPAGRLGSVSRTAPGCTHDRTILRHDRVLDQLPAGAMMDKGSVGMGADAGGRPMLVPAKAGRNRPRTDDQKASNRVLRSYRVVVEHRMAQLNRFRVLGQVFRSVFGRHTRVVALLVDRRIAATPLKTYPVAAWHL